MTSATPAQTVTLVKDAAGTPANDPSTFPVALSGVAAITVAELAKRKLEGMRAQVVLLVDHSGSMRPEFASGQVQQLINRILPLALLFDDDGNIPTIPFDGKIWPTLNVNASNFSTVVSDSIWKTNQMGTTNLTDALEALKKMAESSDAPIFAVVLTDGDPDDQASVEQTIVELARYAVFVKFMALKPVAFLSKLDDLTNRLIDNVDAKPEAGTSLNLLACSDEEFIAALVDEYDTWITTALAAGVLKN